MADLVNNPDIEEARYDAIKQLLVDNLGLLNDMLQRDDLWPSTVPITGAMVTIGQPLTWPASKPPVLICVVGGGRSDELDIETERLYIEQTATNGFMNTLYTNVYLFLHPDAVPGTDVLLQAEQRERVRCRLSGWARRGVFNDVANQTIPLLSRECHIAPEYDFLDRVCAKKGHKGLFDEGFGGSLVCYGAHVLVEAIVG